MFHKNRNISKPNDHFKRVFARWFHNQRKKLNISQAEMAEIIGMNTWQGVAQIETGKTILAEKYWKRFCIYMRFDYVYFSDMMVKFHIKSQLK